MAWNHFVKYIKEFEMKKLTAILISLLTTVAAFCRAFAADAPLAADVPLATGAYINEGQLVIEFQPGMSDTAVAAYYSGRILCGVYLSQTDGGRYTFDIPEGYTKIRVWFTDETETRTVHIIDRASVTSAPTPTPTVAPTPTAEQLQDEDDAEEEYDEGYGGFLVPLNSESEDEAAETFTFSVECHNALSSDALNDELLGILPADGFIAPAAEYELTEGMTVYDALIAAADVYGFEVEYKSGYVSAIGGLREFDCGPFSGWMYIVNGDAIMSPMDSYAISDGDEVRVAYTCLLGDDLGTEVK